jgi:hypothetical protein
MPPFIVSPKKKSKDPNDYSERNSTPRCPELTVLNIDVNPLKTKTISIKGHGYHSVQSSYQSHDLTYQSFYKTHVSHGNNVLSSIAKTNSQGLDAFTCLIMHLLHELATCYLSHLIRPCLVSGLHSKEILHVDAM